MNSDDGDNTEEQMIELGKEHYTREEIESLQKTVVQYFTLLGQDVGSLNEMNHFIDFFLEKVTPKNKEIH